MKYMCLSLCAFKKYHYARGAVPPPHTLLPQFFESNFYLQNRKIYNTCQCIPRMYMQGLWILVSI